MPKNPELTRLGAQIRALRTAKSMTQEDLAFASELDRTYISDLERGNRNPSFVGLQKIAKGLGVTLSELFDSEGLTRLND